MTEHKSNIPLHGNVFTGTRLAIVGYTRKMFFYSLVDSSAKLISILAHRLSPSASGARLTHTYGYRETLPPLGHPKHEQHSHQEGFNIFFPPK